MIAQSPLSRNFKPRYGAASGLQSPLSTDSLTNQWKKGNRNNQSLFGVQVMLQQHERMLAKLRRRILSQPANTASLSEFYPFKIYQPSKYPATGVIFDQSGNQTTINIDANAPTDFTSTPPTVNPSTDGWRIWAVRSGIAEFRNLYADPTTIYSGFCLENDSFAIGGFSIINNTDGVTPFDLQNSSSAQFVIVIHGDPDLFNSVYSFGYSFYISITPDSDDATPPSAKIVGVRFNVNFNNSIYSNQPFPQQSPYVIPVGSVYSDFFNNFSQINTRQIQFGNAVNRYPPSNELCFSGLVSGVPTVTTSGYMNLRGNWDTNENDVQNKLIYPGDVVSYTSGGIKHLYMCAVFHKATPVENPSSSMDWKLII